MKKAISIMIFLTLVLTGFALIPLSVSANTVTSSTINFDGALTYDGTGYTGVLPCVVDGGYDIFAEEGATAYFGDAPGPVWTEQVIVDHDAWPTWIPDTPDWYQYSIEFSEDGGVYKWALRNHPGATVTNPWYDDIFWGSELPPKGVPMSGVVYWYGGGSGGYAEETDTGAYLPATGTAEIPGGAAGQGDCAHAWDMDWSWGSEYVPLEYPGFEIELTDLGGGDYEVALIPSEQEIDPGWMEKEFDPDSGELGDISHVTINIYVPTGLTATIFDWLPMDMRYIGNFELDGDDTVIPMAYGDDYVYHMITDPGTHTIEFDVKVVEAKNWEETEVYNEVLAIYSNDITFNEYDEVPFTILPFEELHKNVGITKADVVFAIDLTGSMSTEIATIKTEATNIMNNLAAQIADVQFGLISFMDYDGWYSTTEPGSDPVTYNQPYGSASSPCYDTPYRLDQDITSNTAAMATAISGLVIGCGGDGPQDYTRIIHESWNDPNLHWRTDAERFLIMFGDNVPHDTNFDIDNDGTLENTGGDPGRDTILGNADDLDFETEVANAAANDVHILGVYSGSPLRKYPWTYMADETDGGYYELTNVGDIPDAIKELIKAEAEKTLTIIEKTEVQWPVYIDVINPFDFPMIGTKIYDRFGGEIKIDYIIAGDTTYLFDPYIHYNKKNAEVTITEEGVGKIGTYDLDKEGVTFGAEPYEFHIYWTGKSHKIHFEWTIGNLGSGEFIGIIMGVSTDTNPKGKQEYTTPDDIYELNSGATLKFFESSLVDTVIVDADNPDPTLGSVILEDGVDYIIKASGTANAGGNFDFDAKWTSIDDWDTWSDILPPPYDIHGPCLLQLHVDGVCIDWGDFNEDHIYCYTYTGTGAEIVLWIWDTYYKNNVGSLTVEIYQAQDIQLSAYTDSIYVTVLPE